MTKMEKFQANSETHERSAPDGEQRSPRPSLTIDYACYEKFLAESDWTEAEKREFITTLWSIIVGFVDLGFGVHPLQQADEQRPRKQREGEQGQGEQDTGKPCGQELDLTSLMATDVISSAKGLPQKQFSKAADREHARSRQGRNYESNE